MKKLKNLIIFAAVAVCFWLLFWTPRIIAYYNANHNR